MRTSKRTGLHLLYKKSPMTDGGTPHLGCASFHRRLQLRKVGLVNLSVPKVDIGTPQK